MDKEFILSEICRTAASNQGKPLGRSRFEKETGIRWSDWYGIHWVRWSDAITEAGLEPNSMQESFGDTFIVEAMIEFIREIGRYPVTGEMRMRGRNNPDFPSHGVFPRKAELVGKIIDYCTERTGFDDILEICKPIADEAPDESLELDETAKDTNYGYVYLLKSGKHYKIGRSNSTGRREYELGIQLPEKATLVHTISTDDPVGIEAYWHNRFQSQRMNGEWFNLSAADIRAFKRRKFM